MSITLNKRQAWIDNARMFAMSCVVIAHIKSAMGTPCTQGFSYWIVSFNMPLFVVLSAYLAFGGLSKITSVDTLLSSIEKYALRIALPTLLATSFFGCVSLLTDDIEGFAGKPIYVLFLVGIIIYWFLLSSKKSYAFLVHASLVFIPITLLYCGYWFMKMLLIMAVCFAVICFVANKIGRVGGAFLGILIFVFLYFYKESYVVEFFPYYLIGLIMRKYDVINKLTISSCRYKRIMPASFLIAVTLLLAFAEQFYFYRHELYSLIESHTVWIWPLRILCAAFWSLFFMLLFKKYSGDYNWFSVCGTLTMGIYFLQQPIFNTLLARNINLPLSTPVYMLVGFGTAFSVLAFVTMVSYLLKKNKFTRDCLLGELKISI